MRAGWLFAALLCLAAPCGAEEPLCTAEEIAELKRWERWLQDEQAALDASYAEFQNFLMASDALHGASVGTDITKVVLDVADSASTLRKLIVQGFGRKVPAGSGRTGSARQRAIETYEKSPAREFGPDLTEYLEQVAGLAGSSPEEIAAEILKAGFDALREKADVKAREINGKREARLRYLPRMRAKYVETRDLCDPPFQVVPRTPLPAARGRNGATAVSPEPAAAFRDSSPAAAAASAPPRVDLGAIDRAVSANTGQPGNAASAPARRADASSGAGRVDLDAIDRAVERETAQGTPDPRSGTQPTRKLSEDAYLNACQGKEKTAACHRAHCLHVGAALNDKKWTADCLRQR